MKIQHIYTVVRDYNIDPEELADEKQFFNGAITDEPSEYLYGGGGDNETISVKMEVVKETKRPKVKD